MAQTFLVFDFGANEEAAQAARHKLEGWRQGFRLGAKLLLQFEREEVEEVGAKETETKSEKKKSAAKEAENSHRGKIEILIRLDFSAHEKLSLQRWLERIPMEEPFKSATGQAVRPGDAAYEKTAERFEALERNTTASPRPLR
ncbi:MAG: hypothetical protein ACRD50_14810 [Candidatus Acidiferrales bacterium]